MKINRLISLLALSLWLPVTGHAGLEDIRQDAEKGRISAQYELGILYEFGFRLPDHETEALAWYSIAAERGSAPAAQRRDLLKARLSAQQVEQAEARSKQLLVGMPAPPPEAPPPPPPAAEVAAPPAPVPPETSAAPAQVPMPEPAPAEPPAGVAPTP